MKQQNEFWAGEAGDQYHQRNSPNMKNTTRFFARALQRTQGAIHSILELGAGQGQNLACLREVLNCDDITGVEINPGAYKKLMKIEGCHAINDSAIEINLERAFDLVLTKGFLIHVSPYDLGTAYNKMAIHSASYILMCEYFNPTPLEVPYQDKTDLLWKRDFCEEFLSKHPAFVLVDYGFVYHLDEYPQDDLTWWLLERTDDQM